MALRSSSKAATPPSVGRRSAQAYPQWTPRGSRWMVRCSPDQRSGSAPPSSGPGLYLLQLPVEGLDLVAELGGVLEAEVLRGGQHLLLQLHHRLADLLCRHALGLPVAPAAGGGHLGLDRQEVADVGDALLDGLRRDAVLPVVGHLDGPAAVGLADRRAH